MLDARNIGVVVIQGASDFAGVTDTLAGLRARGITHLAALTSSSPEADQLRSGFDPPLESVEFDSSDGPDLPTMLRNLSTPFVTGISPGYEVDVDGLSRRIAALEQHPHLVMAVSRVAALDFETGGSDAPVAGAPHEVDGRDFAHQVLVKWGSDFQDPSAITFRRSAIGTDRQPGIGQVGDDWCLRLSLSMLRSGGVWVDTDDGAGASQWESTEWEAPIERWPGFFALAVRLGLIDDHAAASEAAIAFARRVARTARRCVVDSGRLPERVTEAVRSVSTLFRQDDAQRHAEDGELALHIVVNLSNGEHDATTIFAALGSATRVTLIGPRAIEEAAGYGVEVGPPVSSASEIQDAVASVVATSDLPVLLVHGGETPVVMDRYQLWSFLRQPGWQTASLCTPSGWQTRLWSGMRTNADSSATGGTDGVQAVGSGSADAGFVEHASVVQSLQLLSVGTEASADWWLQGEDLTAQPHQLRRFVIAAPDYTDIHGGVVAMHRLCDRLNHIGYEAYIEPLGDATGITRPGWDTPLWWRPNFDDTVMVYPEIVTGNPLGAHRVVRWLLNRPAWFTGNEMSEDGDDLIVAFSPQIAPDRPVLTVPLFDPTIFFPKDVEGRGGLLWIGKGVVPPHFDRGDLTLITNSWPTSRHAMADLLRKAEVLYTCDWLTTIIGEALMCGTPVVLVGDQAWRREDITMWPGMAWEDQGSVLGARQQAMHFVDDYRSSVGWSDQIVENFVATVNEHFTRHPLDRSKPADLGPTLPTYSTRITAGVVNGT